MLFFYFQMSQACANMVSVLFSAYFIGRFGYHSKGKSQNNNPAFTFGILVIISE